VQLAVAVAGQRGAARGTAAVVVVASAIGDHIHSLRKVHSALEAEALAVVQLSTEDCTQELAGPEHETVAGAEPLQRPKMQNNLAGLAEAVVGLVVREAAGVCTLFEEQKDSCSSCNPKKRENYENTVIRL
jgi:hypothetical protein